MYPINPIILATSLNYIQVKHTALCPAYHLSTQRSWASPTLYVSEVHPSHSVYELAVDVDPKDEMQVQAVADRGGVGESDLVPLVRIRNLVGSLQDRHRDEPLLDVACESGGGDECGSERGVVSYAASGPFETLLV
ncbi:unnamed protein product [Fusarium venenatum]|uniref:Uncharacterized protein n=1 Tax=Fusarium venenatum TaxID=56646 RepID=A0A2L2T9W7_9HYPO|nr:uncharacterized protein FVRRES_03171 [Fusarium venenatum]CEI66659.1 unnamed protein product [Fusarium venenatum]